MYTNNSKLKNKTTKTDTDTGLKTRLKQSANQAKLAEYPHGHVINSLLQSYTLLLNNNKNEAISRRRISTILQAKEAPHANLQM